MLAAAVDAGGQGHFAGDFGPRRVPAIVSTRAGGPPGFLAAAEPLALPARLPWPRNSGFVEGLRTMLDLRTLVVLEDPGRPVFASGAAAVGLANLDVFYPSPAELAEVERLWAAGPSPRPLLIFTARDFAPPRTNPIVGPQGSDVFWLTPLSFRSLAADSALSNKLHGLGITRVFILDDSTPPIALRQDLAALTTRVALESLRPDEKLDAISSALFVSLPPQSPQTPAGLLLVAQVSLPLSLLALAEALKLPPPVFKNYLSSTGLRIDFPSSSSPLRTSGNRRRLLAALLVRFTSSGGDMSELRRMGLKILSNIADQPLNQRFRTLNPSSPKIKEIFLDPSAGPEILDWLGFADDRDDTGKPVRVNRFDTEQIGEARNEFVEEIDMTQREKVKGRGVERREIERKRD